FFLGGGIFSYFVALSLSLMVFEHAQHCRVGTLSLSFDGIQTLDIVKRLPEELCFSLCFRAIFSL
ncbi:MAG: hypothetical protein ACQESC_03170, partial [Nanobdellota archaeon]